MKNTKWQQKILRWHYYSTHYTIYDCYANPSMDKRRAFHKIMDEYSKMPVTYDDIISVHDFKVISFNKMMFTCGFYFMDKDGDWFFKYFSHRRTICFRVHDFPEA